LPAREWQRPKKDETLKLLDALNKRYERDLEMIEETRALRSRTWEINVPEELKEITGASGLEYHDPTISEDLDSLPTLYTAKLPSLQVKADKRAGEATVDDLCTRIEEFTTGSLFGECGTRDVGPPTHERLFGGVFEGVAVTMLLKRQDRWATYDAVAAEGYDAEYATGKRKGQRKYKDRAEYERVSEETKKDAGVPVDWLYKDPATIRPRYEGSELVEVIEVQERDVVECLEQYALGMDDKGQICPGATAVNDWASRLDGATKVRFIQRWNPVWRQYIVAFSGAYGAATVETAYEIEEHTVEHGYGFLPYEITLGGRTKSYEFGRLATAHASDNKTDLVKYISFGRTILGYLGVRDALAILYETIPEGGIPQFDGDTKAPKGPVQYKMGTKYTGQPGGSLTAVTFPNVSDKMQAEVVQAENRLRRMGPTEVTGSLEGAGEAMAAAFERDRAQRNRDESAIVRHLTNITLKFWKLLATFDEPIYVFHAAAKGGAGYIKIDPDDFRVALRPVYSLHVDSMASDMVREQYLARRQKNGTLGQDQAIERQGDNIVEVLKAIAKQEFRLEPAYKESIKSEIFARWQRGDWMKDQTTAQGIVTAAQQQAGPAPQGAPPGLAVPPGANGQTSAGVSVNPSTGMTPGGIQPGVPAGTPAPPTASMPAGAAGAHGGAPVG
jgi:hypothetical protein